MPKVAHLQKVKAFTGDGTLGENSRLASGSWQRFEGVHSCLRVRVDRRKPYCSLIYSHVHTLTEEVDPQSKGLKLLPVFIQGQSAPEFTHTGVRNDFSPLGQWRKTLGERVLLLFQGELKPDEVIGSSATWPRPKGYTGPM